MTTPTAIYIQHDIALDNTGDEIDAFSIFAGDDYAEPIGTVITAYNEHTAWNVAESIAAGRKLPLVGPRD